MGTGGEDANDERGEFVKRLTIMERIAEESEDLETWTRRLRTRFRLRDRAPHWLADDDPWSFLRAVRNELGESLRISDGADLGLW